MSGKDNGGPAFPSAQLHDFDDPTKGMTLRDYFAAKALAGILADPNSATVTIERVARAAYEYADAILVERDK